MPQDTAGGWRKSSRSAANGDCVEAASWHASRACESGACIQVTACACPRVQVRDSQDPDGPRLAFAAGAWSEFTAALKAT